MNIFSIIHHQTIEKYLIFSHTTISSITSLHNQTPYNVSIEVCHSHVNFHVSFVTL